MLFDNWGGTSAEKVEKFCNDNNIPNDKIDVFVMFLLSSLIERTNDDELNKLMKEEWEGFNGVHSLDIKVSKTGEVNENDLNNVAYKMLDIIKNESTLH